MGKCVTARQATGDNITGRMRFACRITKATDTHSEFAMLITFFTATVVTRTRLDVKLCVHCLSCSSQFVALYGEWRYVECGGKSKYSVIRNFCSHTFIGAE